MSKQVTTKDVVKAWDKAARSKDPNGHITNQWAHLYHDHMVSGLVEVGQVIQALRWFYVGWTFLEGSLLDYGCGTGRHSLWFAQAFRLVYACDASPEMLRIAMGQTPSNTRNLKPLHTDGASIPLPDESIGVFFSTICLQHQTRECVTAILANAQRVLSHGGVAIFQLPVVSDASKAKGISAAGTSAHGNTAVWHIEEFTEATRIFTGTRKVAVDNHFGFHILSK